jgi:hypothetical protein
MTSTQTNLSALIAAVLAIIGAGLGLDPSQVTPSVAGIVTIIGAVALALNHKNEVSTLTASASTTGTTGAAQSANTTAQTAIPQLTPDFTVTQTPAFGIAVKQPCLATLIMRVGANAKGLIVDWQDGSAPESIPLNPAGDGSFMATANHTYNLNASELQVGSNKYTGHTFYPLVTVLSNNGGTWTFDQPALDGVASPNMGRCICFEVEE